MKGYRPTEPPKLDQEHREDAGVIVEIVDRPVTEEAVAKDLYCFDDHCEAAS